MNSVSIINGTVSPSAPPWTIALLGSLSATNQDQSRTITRFRSHKYGALLAYLAYHRSAPHTREMLIALLWPELSERAGRNNLSVALSSLRSQLEPPGMPQGTVLCADRFHVSLSPGAVITDVAIFQDALDQAGRTRSTMERGQLLSRAIDLYRGPLLKGYDGEWITGEREYLSGLFFGALGQWIRDLEEADDLSAALSYARRGVIADPFQEEGQTHLIRLLVASGQTDQALRQFREFERVLLEQSGDEPSASLWSLIRQVEKEAGLAATQPRARTRMNRSRSARPLSGTAGRGASTRATLTFLLTELTDIEGAATGRNASYHQMVPEYQLLIRDAITLHGPMELSEAAGSFGLLTAAFTNAGAALHSAIDAQRALQSHAWPEGGGLLLPVRMAIHTGDVELQQSGQIEQTPVGELRARLLHRVSRMLTAAHGGQVLLSEATASLVREGLNEGNTGDGVKGDVHLVDLGVHRLRDVSAPVRLFQVNHPGMVRTEFPPLAAERGCEPNLPPPAITRFFGRTREIADLDLLLRDGRTSLVTITGAGGTGKTRFALEAAGRLVPHFDGAVFFVPLAGIGDPRLIPNAILQSLRVARSPSRDPLDQAVEALGKQPTLLLLDNLEHLIDSGGTEAVEALLSRVPSLTLLVTSRVVPGKEMGREFALLPLPTPGGGEGTPEALAQVDSVALFVDRAQAAKPDFQITESNAPAIAELCDRLEGIPLAIELAAARSLVLPPAQMLAQLSDRFAFLTSRRRGVEDRLRTLRGAIDWSYQLLSPELQRFFCRLSVFRGGWTMEAAQAVCEEPEHSRAVSGLVMDYLAQLRDASMVLSEETGDGISQMRFRMLETLREFGHELLDQAGETEAISRRHVAFFRTLAATPGWQRQGTEIDNLRVALDWSKGSTSGGDVRAALQLAGALANFWWYAGLLREGDDYLSDLLSRNEKSTPDAVRAKALGGRAWIRVRLGHLSHACSLYQESLHIYRQLDDRKGVAVSLNTLADTLRMVGRHEESRALQEESLSLFQEIGDSEGISFAFRDLGDLALRLGEFTEARRCYEESDIAIGGMNAMTPLRLAEIVLLEGNYDEARRRGEERAEALRISPQRRAEALMIVGAAALYQGELDGARARFSESLRRFQEIGGTLFIPRSLRIFAYLALLQAEPERAAQLLGASEALCEALETPLPPCERSEYEQHVRNIRGALSENAFSAAWEAGRALPWEEAVAYALEASNA